MTEGSINKVLYNVDQRADTTDAEKKTARDNIGALGADEIPAVADDRYKLLQYPIDQTYASYAVIDRFTQDRQGVATVHCSYLTVATDSSNGLMGASDKAKLNTVSYNAEQNVQADWNETDPSSDAYIRNKPSQSVQVQADWNETNSSSDAFIKNKPTVPELSWQQVTQGSSNTFPADQLKIHQDYHTVTMHTTGGSDVQLGLVVPNPQSTDDGKVLKAIDNGVDGTAIAWGDAPNAERATKDQNGDVIDTTYLKIANMPAIPTAGRNMNLNQYNAMQTNLPGGLYDAPANQSNDFTRLTGADFAGAYRLACRHNTSDNYELAIAYTASGMSSSYSFIGTETIVATDNSVTTKQAVYLGESCYYTPTTKFGGVTATAFDPTRHKAIIYDGIAQIGPTSDCKIVIYSDANSNVKIAFTAIEVGKVGSTT